MQVVVAGASQGTGRSVAEQASARGWDVIALARRPVDLGGVQSRSCDITDAAAVADAFTGVTPDAALISAVGVGASREPTRLYSEGVANLAAAMTAHGMRRIVAVSAVPVGDRSNASWSSRHMVLPLLDRFFGESYRDMGRMERWLAESGLDWTSVRPPRLTSSSATAYRIDDAPLPRGGQVGRAALACALLDLVTERAYVGRAAYVAQFSPRAKRRTSVAPPA